MSSSWADKLRGGASQANPNMPSLGESRADSNGGSNSNSKKNNVLSASAAPALPSTTATTPALSTTDAAQPAGASSAAAYLRQQHQQQSSATAATVHAAWGAGGAASKAIAQSQKQQQQQQQQSSPTSSSSTSASTPASPPSQPNNSNSAAAAAAAAPATPIASGGQPPFDYYVVLDFEATCDDNKRLKHQEIIEFPSVVVDARRSVVVAEFQRYVRPVHGPALTPFCTNLTGIPQEAVDEAAYLPQVWAEYINWLHVALGFDPAKNSAKFAWVTCGDWDLKTCLPTALKNPRVQPPAADAAGAPGAAAKINWDVLPKAQPDFLARWVNLKTVYAHVAQRGVRSMHDMASVFKTPMGGHHHSGISDCRNIAKLLIALLRQGHAVNLTWGQLSAAETAQRLQSDYATSTQGATFASSLAKLSDRVTKALDAAQERSKAWQAQDDQQKQLAAAGPPPAYSAAAATAGGGSDAGNRRKRGMPQDAQPAQPSNNAAAGGAAPAASAAAAAASQLALGPYLDIQGTNDDALARIIPPGDAAAAAAVQASRAAAGEMTAVSKRLSSALRHNALQWRIPMSLNGWVKVKDLQRNNRFSQVTLPQLAALAAGSDKQRFALGIGAADRELYIRANQGHSIDGLVVDMEAITDPAQAPVAVHGTTMAAWEKIRTQGLCRMNRQHVHFASGLPGEDGVISGMRAKSQVLVYLDVRKALQAGLKILKSANGVILTAGVDGFVAPSLFLKAVDASTGRDLSF